MKWNRHAALLAAAIALAIVYGSLYPFEFVHGNPAGVQPFAALLASWRTPLERSDFLANVLFYIPLGFFLVRSISSRRPIGRIALAAALGAALSLAMELAQFYVADRYTSVWDLSANTTGSLLGAVAGVVFVVGIPKFPEVAWRPFVFLLLLSWLAWRLFPFEPVTDIHKYWDALKPLVYTPTLQFADVFRDTAVWLALGLMFEELTGIKRSRQLLLLTIFAILIARVTIVDKFLSVSELVGAAAGGLLWLFVFSRLRLRPAAIAILFAAAVAAHDLQPFHFSSTRHALEWMPFATILDASAEESVIRFFENVFICGTLLWLAVRAGLRLWSAALLCAAAYGVNHVRGIVSAATAGRYYKCLANARPCRRIPHNGRARRQRTAMLTTLLGVPSSRTLTFTVPGVRFGGMTTLICHSPT